MVKNEVFQASRTGFEFLVYITPGANKEEMTSLVCRGGNVHIKISIQARPVDNQANVALIKFIAAKFGVAKTRVFIKRGGTSRCKCILIEGLGLNDIPLQIVDFVKANLVDLPNQIMFDL